MLKIACLLLALGVANGSGAVLTPIKLECEAQQNPVGLDSGAPRLSWKLISSRNGERQTAYEIQAASSQQVLLNGVSDLWSTRKIVSAEKTWIPYAGKPLHSFQTVWWRVRVWSRAGELSGWSEPARWTEALLNLADRRGSWIAAPTKALVAGPMPIIRHEFVIRQKPSKAMLLISGLGFYESSINGRRVGDLVLAPLWTNYRQSIRYNSFDVTASLREGANAISVLLGNGTFNVVGGRYSKYTGSFGNPRLWAQLHLEYADGSTQDVSTDEAWRTTPGPITFSDFYGGEDYDSRVEPFGWHEPGFDDSQWAPVSPTDSPGGELVADSGPGIRVQERLQPVRVTQPKPGVFVYDLGQNFSGWPRLIVSGKDGDVVRLTPGELLDRSGLVSQRSSGGPMYYSYTVHGTQRQEWAPRFTYYGFRYVQVEGAAPESAKLSDKAKLYAIEGEFVYFDASITGKFSSSEATLNRIHSLVVAAMKSNLQGVLTDCPHREKLGWLEQAYLMGPSLLFEFDLRRFLPKVFRDIREAQTPTGLIPDIAPEYVQFGGGFRDSAEWGSAGVMLPWMAWQWYGDRSALVDTYQSMKGYVDYLQTQQKNGLLRYGLGDWYDIAPGPPGPSKLTQPGITSTATYFGDLKIVAEAAQVLEKSDDREALLARAEATRRAFQEAFYHSNENIYGNGSQTSLALPMMTGIADSGVRDGLISRLVADIRARGNHTSAGDIGYRYVIESLTAHHLSSVIFDMATEKTAPSYAGQLAAGATTLTEAWDANPESSQNHLMLGHIEEWFYNGLAGIRPEFLNSGGFSKVIIDPSPVGAIKAVEATWESNQGAIGVKWNTRGTTFSLDVSIPPGIEAEILLPTTDRRLVSAPKDAEFVRTEKDRVAYHSESGHYLFSVQRYNQ